MKFAAHTDLLVLGVGSTADEAYADAEKHHADPDLLDIVRIEDDAAAYVERGGDCRGLTLGEDDILRLRA